MLKNIAIFMHMHAWYHVLDCCVINVLYEFKPLVLTCPWCNVEALIKVKKVDLQLSFLEFLRQYLYLICVKPMRWTGGKSFVFV